MRPRLEGRKWVMGASKRPPLGTNKFCRPGAPRASRPGPPPPHALLFRLLLGKMNGFPRNEDR
eukprot:1032835-Prymnesium_polylepis.1